MNEVFNSIISNTVILHTIVIVLGIVFLVPFLGLLLYSILKSPFSYPYFIYEFDVSGKRSPQIDDLLDTFLISDGYKDIKNHQRIIDEWKQESCQRIERSILKKYRRRQYERALDDNKAYVFYIVRLQTRYKQRHYVKLPYKMMVRTNSFVYDYEYIQCRYNELANINFECTLSAYHCKNQRKLATRKLREKIMQRDNYTCQICGKYMPDEVGLQVDHIIPVSKGGKTVASNLRVLCSKCNSSKSDKVPI